MDDNRIFDEDEFDDLGSNFNVLKVKTANDWIDGAKSRPIPKRLFGDLCIEGELCIGFSSTGTGKTVLATQMGESWAAGKAIPGFDLGVAGLRVLYLDFELSDKQFEGRYGVRIIGSDYYTDHYIFNDNFYRAEIDLSHADFSSPDEFQEQLQRSIAFAVATKDINALIVDNLTWLRDETEKARAAAPLMKALNDLKRRFDLSILVLAHTPKRDLSQPITLNHLQGSAMISNFADSIFAIGQSVKDPGMRYLKQLKVRSAPLTYGSENVKTCQLVKDGNFLRFEFGDETPESIHLKQLTDDDRANQRQVIERLHAEGNSQHRIAQELGISSSTVNKYVKRIETERSQGVRGVHTEGERTNEAEAADAFARYGPAIEAIFDAQTEEEADALVRSFVRGANGTNGANAEDLAIIEAERAAIQDEGCGVLN